MARVARRRFLTPAEARARRPLSPAQRLGPVGWVFTVLAVTWAVVELRPITEYTAFRSISDVSLLVVRTLGDMALLALPAGLLLGFPGVRRRNPWLFRGLVIIALVQLAQPALRALQGWVFEQVDPSAAGFNPLYAAMTMVSLAIAVASLAGVWALSDGLSDAGARPRRAAIVLIVAAAVALELVFFVPVVATNGLQVFWNGILDVVSLAVSVASYAVWVVVGARLVAGSAAGLVPRRAWALGALAGALLILEQPAFILFAWAGQLTGTYVGTAPLIAAMVSAIWVLFFLALALGLGRGTNRGAGDRRRIHRYRLSRLGQTAPVGSSADPRYHDAMPNVNH